MKTWGIQIASERRMRLVATELSIDNNVVAENALFSFPLKSGGEELRPAPIAYLPHLKCNTLTWHNGQIPTNEVWVKLRGDKGGSYLK